MTETSQPQPRGKAWDEWHGIKFRLYTKEGAYKAILADRRGTIDLGKFASRAEATVAAVKQIEDLMPQIIERGEKITEPVLDPRAMRRLTKDLVEASLTEIEVRFLVDTYYQWQDTRKASGNQLGSTSPAEPLLHLRWLIDQSDAVEAVLRKVLGAYSQRSPIGRWAESIHGIAGVLSAGLLAHIDMRIATTAGKIFSFGGWNPKRKWEEGEKRPWNTRLKTLFWKIGDSFVKTKGSPKSFYGPFYDQAKERLEELNVQGKYADAARVTLEQRPNHKQASIYKQGILPDGRVDLRARRVAVKLFISHWHEVAYYLTYGKVAPAPYVFTEHMSPRHTDYIPPPNMDLIPGLRAALKDRNLTLGLGWPDGDGDGTTPAILHPHPKPTPVLTPPRGKRTESGAARSTKNKPAESGEKWLRRHPKG